jgi:hypothetical protein
MLLTQYQEFKLIVVELTGLSKDAIHIYVGLFIFFATVTILKKGKFDSSALIPVFIVALLMEIIDLIGNYQMMDSMYWGNSIHDLVNTLFWPLAIILLARFKSFSLGED